MSDPRVEAFRDALAAGDHAAATEGFDPVDEALAARDRRESAVRNVARGLKTRADDDAAREAAEEFLELVGTAQQLRFQVKYDFMLYVEGGPSGPEVAEKLDDLVALHDAIDSTAEQVRQHADGLDLPPQVALTGPGTVEAAKGTTVDATYTVENVGATAISDLELSLETEDGPPLAISPTSPGTLPAGESVEATVSGPADEAGSFPVVVQTSVGDSLRASLEILDTGSYLDRALTTIEDLRERIGHVDEALRREGGGGGGGGGNGGNGKGNGNGKGQGLPPGLGKKLDTAEKRIEAIQADLDGGNGGGNGGGKGNGGRPIDQRIGAVANLMEAFRNQALGLAGGKIPERQGAVLAGDADRTIRWLEAAIEAGN